MNRFRISFVTSDKNMTTILELLRREISDLKIEQLQNGAAAVVHRYTGGIVNLRPENSRVYQAALEWVKQQKPGSTFSTRPDDHLAKFLEKAGFKPSNASSITTVLIREGKAKRIGRGKVQVL